MIQNLFSLALSFVLPVFVQLLAKVNTLNSQKLALVRPYVCYLSLRHIHIPCYRHIYILTLQSTVAIVCTTVTPNDSILLNTACFCSRMILTTNSDFLPNIIHRLFFLIEVRFVVCDIGSEFVSLK